MEECLKSTVPLVSSLSPHLWTLKQLPGTPEQHIKQCILILLYSYELVVEACDRGAQQCCTNATITVDVLDVNDNRPEITNINTEACTDVLEVKQYSVE